MPSTVNDQLALRSFALPVPSQFNLVKPQYLEFDSDTTLGHQFT